jgi:hypothetical protein
MALTSEPAYSTSTGPEPRGDALADDDGELLADVAGELLPHAAAPSAAVISTAQIGHAGRVCLIIGDSS